MVDVAQGALVAAEKAKLRKVLSRFDLVLFTACAIVSLDSVAFAAEAGAQAITWLLISLVLFLIRTACWSPSWARRSRSRAARTSG